MISEWLKVMLEEISRKRTEEQQARIEEQRRCEEASNQSDRNRTTGATPSNRCDAD